MLQFQRVPTILAMLQHHTPNQQPKSSKIQQTHKENGGQSWKRRETVNFRSILQQGYTTVRQHCIIIAIDDSAHPGKRVYLNYLLHLVPQKSTKLTKNSSKGKGTSLRGNTKNWCQEHQSGHSIDRMLQGNQQ